MSIWRRLRNLGFWGLCGLAALAIAGPALWVLFTVFHQALPVVGWHLLTHNTNAGGLKNAILGTLWLLLGVLVLAGTVGVGSGIYLAEFAPPRIEHVMRFFSDVLAGMPSIVLGYVAYITLVVQVGWGYSYIAGVIALSVLVLPYIVKTTEVALRQVPRALREGAAGLGMPDQAILWKVVFPPALPGIMSGVIVALAISTGELAPLLFTVGFTDSNPSLALTHEQVPYLTSVIFTNLQLPDPQAQYLSAAAGAVSLVLLVILILIGRLITARSVRATRRMAL
ncbi:MAG TPA: phosphate ABC transporter permease PstA [Propionibacteriaceae bacterium]|nr:phosphate ABC transporter permease PstA [Propionibacteriaceae bacterium]